MTKRAVDSPPRRFVLVREQDRSGVSGIGNVAIGVQMPTGRVILEWTIHPFTISLHDSIHAVIQVHGHGGCTSVHWIDEIETEHCIQEIIKPV